MRYPVIGLSGSSGSGKTTLLEKILPLFVGMGFTVNVVKSARIRKAGAAEVILASPYRFMLAHELKEEEEPTLDELISRMKPADLTLVEGFKDAAIPRIEIFRPSLGKEPMYPENDRIEVVASDEGRPEKLPRPVEWLDLNNEKQVVDWILNRQTTC